jgi:flagellar biosynthesis/type III secretory pathway protein FliH
MAQILSKKHAQQQDCLAFEFVDMADDSSIISAIPGNTDAVPSATGFECSSPARHSEAATHPTRSDRNVPDTATQAVDSVLEQVDQAHRQWTANAQRDVFELAVAIAQRIVRRELKNDPQIPLALVHEALDMVGRGRPIRIVLHPKDLCDISEQVQTSVDNLRSTAPVEIASDERVERGGCLVETPHGLIDQTFTAQLQRIRDELDMGP